MNYPFGNQRISPKAEDDDTLPEILAVPPKRVSDSFELTFCNRCGCMYFSSICPDHGRAHAEKVK